MKSRDELVKEVASDILNDKNFSKIDWDSISVTIRFEPPSIWEGAIAYTGNEYVSEHPAGFDLSYRMVELRDLMKEEDGSEWLTCLIKISALTQEIDIDFEYEDVRRWYMTPTMDSEEIRAYAMSIK